MFNVRALLNLYNHVDLKIFTHHEHSRGSMLLIPRKYDYVVLLYKWSSGEDKLTNAWVEILVFFLVMILWLIKVRKSSCKAFVHCSSLLSLSLSILGKKREWNRLSDTMRQKTDGQMERINHLLKEYLRPYVSASQQNWVALLDTTQFCYNLHKSFVTEISPFEIILGK